MTWGFRARWTGAALAVVCPVVLWAATSGPDSAGLILIDSVEDDGPPHVMVDMGSASAVEAGPIELPFAFGWGSELYDSATLSEAGSLSFDGTPAACPGEGDWSGFLAGGLGSTILFRELGRFPRRGLVWDWAGRQLVLLEDRYEGVIHVDAVAEHAGLGAQAGSGSGVTWTCDDAIDVVGRTAWMSKDTSRSVAQLRSTSALSQAWWGSHAAEFFGESVAVGAVNEDALSEVLVGQPELDRAHLFYGAFRDDITESDGASLVLTGPDGSGFGRAVLLTDVDGDGLDDALVSAPAAGAGTIYVFLAATGLSGERSSADADGWILGPDGVGAMGETMALGDYDGDGEIDLAAGAPDSHTDAAFGGAVMVVYGPDLGDGERVSVPTDVRYGDHAGGLMGTSLVAIDLDGDGVDELAVGIPGGDGSEPDSGQVAVFSVPLGLSDAAPITLIQGAEDGDKFGSSLAAGALSGPANIDLVVGAVGVDIFGGRTGAAYVFTDPDTGVIDTLDATVTITGDAGGSAAGSSIAVGQLDDDAPLELVLGASGGSPSLGGGGMVAIFRQLPGADVLLNEADHRLYGESSGSALGSKVGIAEDLQGDGYPDVLVAAPLDSPGARTGAGAVWVWPFIPAYLDMDGDGFVAAVSGGLDCQDADASVNPNTLEIPGNTVDDDCNGWVDDLFVPRRSDLGWRYDLADVLSVDGGRVFDFEDAVEGVAADDVYSSEGMELIASGAARVKPSIWGADPVDALGVRVTAGSDANDLIFDFLAPVDAIGLRILDAEVGLRMDALFEGELVVEGYFFEADGPDTPGGVFQAFTFASPIDTFRIAASSPNGWGVDEVEVIFAAGTDRDGDGFTVEDGDCDDFDADVSPAGTEIYGDGIDNDCDGVIDGGAPGVYYSEGAFASTVSIIGDRIDFEEPVLGAVITNQYLLRGVEFAGGLTVAEDIGLTPPRDTQAGSISTDTLIINFTENQPALALWLLDVDGAVTLEARRDGTAMYSETLTEGHEGFIGLEFPVPIDTFILRNSVSGEDWGVDDVTFSVLGLDDADGDGFTELDGDCDDADAEAYPGGEEVWYDGIDGDCDGEDDYDADGDGYSSSSSGGFDCDDFEDSTHPGAEDDWYDGVDSDCRGDDDFDADGDGHSSGLYGGGDCDDTEDAVHPDAEEVFYDETDDDCDPTTDHDADGDGYASGGFPGAIGAIGVGDCDDTEDSTHPDAVETWYDGIDSDCGEDDDFDADADGHIPIEYGGDDCDDGDGGAVPGAPEDVCYDGIDADCDGLSDFDCDRDGHDATAWGGGDCDDADPDVFPGDGTTPLGTDQDCDGYVDVEDGGLDCDDSDASIHPGADEIWYDGRDSDCDGGDDYDRDGDGFYPGAWAGEGVSSDCDDGDPDVHPGATDGCGGGDEDCDGEYDEDCVPPEDTGSSDPDSDEGIDLGSDSGEPAEDREDTGVFEPEDTGSTGPQMEDSGTVDDSDTGSSSGVSGEQAAPVSTGSAPGGPEKSGNCGCKSIDMVASWVWFTPLLVATRRRERESQGGKR